MLAEIVRRVDTEAVARRLVERFKDEIEGYSRLSGAAMGGEVADVSRRNLELFFRTITDAYTLRPEDFEPFRESAKKRATEGLPLEDLLHAYRLGGRMCWQLIAENATPEEQPALLAAATRVMEYIDQVSSAVAQTYMEERQHLVSEEERGLRNLVDALCGEGPLEPDALETAERIGFPVADHYRPFSQSAQGAPAREHSQFAARLRSGGILALTEGDRVTGLATVDADIPRANHECALIALGEPAPRRSLAEALEDVRLLLDIGCRTGRTGEITTDSFLPELLLARSPRLAARLRERVLGPLEGSGEGRSPDLLETLDVFLGSGLDRRLASERLHVHPNTLNYRLRRIEEETGLQLTQPTDITRAALALRQRALS